MLKINGIGCVNATPLTEDNKINEKEYRRHIRWLSDNGIGFIQPAAATGQAMQTSEEEYKRLLEISVDELKDTDTLVTAYAGRPGTEETIRMCKIARDAGADAAYIIQPFFTRPDKEGVYLHYKAIAEALPDFPLVFYNNSDRAGIDLPLDVMVRLVDEYKNFVGLKQADLNQVMDSFAALRNKITCWPKSEKEILFGLALDAPGVLTFAANVVPAELVEILNSWKAGDFDHAREVYYRILPIINLIHIEAVPGPIKYMLNQMGWDFGKPRLPVHEPNEADKKKIDDALRKLGKIK